MSSSASYCLTCLEAIDADQEEVAFCSLACQTRAFLIVAEAQQRQSRVVAQAPPGQTAAQISVLRGSQPAWSSSSSTSYDAAAACAASSTTPKLQAGAPVSVHTLNNPGPRAGSSAKPATPSALHTAAANRRPALRTRHSIAVVNDMLKSHLQAVAASHPIIASLNSDVLAVAERASAPGQGTRQNSSYMTVPTDRDPRSQTSSTSFPSASPAHLGSAAVRVAATVSPPSMATSTFASTTSAEELYRQHYPKFTRRIQENSPKTARLSLVSDPGSSSTISDLPLLTPPPTLRPLLDASLEPPHSSDRFTKSSQHFDPSFLSPSKQQQQQQHQPKAVEAPLVKTSPLSHTPERRSAPRRSIELSPNPSRSSSGSDATITRHVLPLTINGDYSHLAPPQFRNVNGSSPALAVPSNNSLGLDIQHVEHANMKTTSGHSSLSSSYDVHRYSLSASPRDHNDENRPTPLQHDPNTLYFSSKNTASNPVSPPKCRSPLSSVHANASTGPARRGLKQNAIGTDAVGLGGWRSVEASRYTLGPKEASYIVRKLAEEQRKRQAKESAAGRDDLETRGRSRVRKRAGSWGNVLDSVQGQSR